MSGDYAPLLLKNQLCFPIYLCSKEIVNLYTPLLEALELTYTQYVVMMYFWEKGSSNVKQLSDTLLLDPSTLTPLLKKLEQKGYLRRERNADDERSLTVTLTETGLALREKAISVPNTMRECIDLTEEESRCLYGLLYKVLQNIEKNKEKEE